MQHALSPFRCQTAAEPVPDDLDKDMTEAWLDLQVQIVAGWRVSYRSEAPELRSHLQHITYLKTNRDATHPVLHMLPEARRHISLVDSYKAAKNRQNNRKHNKLVAALSS